MGRRKVAVIVFYDNGRNILIQDRRNIKKWGEGYGLFGGKIEKNEEPEQALKREIKEELNINIKNFKLFKHFTQEIKEINLEVERFVFISKMPELEKLKVREGKAAIMKFEDSFKLKMVPGDIDILKEMYNSLKLHN